jgi:GTP cyclohydrolase I
MSRAEELIENQLLFLCQEDPNRDGLRDTPSRVVKAWEHWCGGYNVNIPELLTEFDNEEKYDEMVTVKNIPLYSHCEHHLAPFFGTATVSYIPNGKIVGLSKINRVVDAFARRLQVQERITIQVADAIMQHLHTRGVGVMLRCRHLCMESRGVCQQGHHTITTALRGVMKTDPAARAEFLAAARD